MHLDVEGVWLVYDADMTQWYFAWREATAAADAQGGPEEDETDTALLSERHGWPFTFIYKRDDGGDLLEPGSLRDMCRFEAILMTSELYREYCQRDASGRCGANAASLLQAFYGNGNFSGYDWRCELLDEAQVQAQKTLVMQSLQTQRGSSPYAVFADANALARGQISITRSIVGLGYPTQEALDAQRKALEEGETASRADSAGQQAYEEEVWPLIEEVESALFAHTDDKTEYGFGRSAYQVDSDRFTRIGSLAVRFWVPYRNDFMLIQDDFLFAGGSVLFVFAYMYFHLRSCFMAGVGMLQIVCSLPIAGLFYQGVFQVKFFQFIHILTIFLVLGIGADDLFVLTDTWRGTAAVVPCMSQSGVYSHAELKERMLITYRRTLTAILNTSFTTAMAFLSCSGSKVMPMRTNGWYAALAIVINFVLTVTLSPATLMIHEYRLAGKRRCCPDWSSSQDMDTVRVVDACDGTEKVEKAEKVEKSAAHAQKGGKLSLSQRAIDQVYLPAMRLKVGPVRVVALACAVLLGGNALQGVISAVQLTPPLEEEVWYPDNHMHTHWNTYMRDSFYSASQNSQHKMMLLWGVESLDQSGFNIYNPQENPGRPVYDASFDLSRPEAQQALLDTCAALRTVPCSLKGCSSADGLLVQNQPGSVSCFLEDLGPWLRDRRAAAYAAAVSAGASASELARLRAERDKGAELSTGAEFLQDLAAFRTEHMPSAEQREQAGANWQQQIGFVDGSLRYVVVSFRSSMQENEPLGSGADVRDLVLRFADDRRSQAPASLPGPFLVSGKFAFFVTSEELISGFFMGCAIAGPVSFLVLLIATRNIVLAVYAVLSVAAIVVCVLGFCKYPMGYSLGIGESIAGVIVIGYAVDYVVHLAHMYQEAAEHGLETREERATFAMKNMGATVFAGAVTTAGAGIIMFACFSTFFHKMALLILMTITYSFLYSLGFFIPLTFLIGPERDFGSIACAKCAGSSQASGGTP